MKKLMLSLVVLGFAASGFASEAVDPELANELQLDSSFEANQNSQLQTDTQFAKKESEASQKEFNAEKNRVARLKSQNDQLTRQVEKDARIAQEKKKQALVETRKADQLESKLASINKQLEKIKIKNVELRKSIDQARERQMRASNELKVRQAEMAQHAALNRKLHGKKVSFGKKSKNRRMAAL